MYVRVHMRTIKLLLFCCVFLCSKEFQSLSYGWWAVALVTRNSLTADCQFVPFLTRVGTLWHRFQTQQRLGVCFVGCVSKQHMEQAYGSHQCCGAIFITAFVSSGVSYFYLSMLEVGAIQMLPVLPGTNRPSEVYTRLFSGNEVSFDYIYK